MKTYTTIELIILLACGKQHASELDFNTLLSIANKIARYTPITPYFRFMQVTAMENVLFYL